MNSIVSAPPVLPAREPGRDGFWRALRRPRPVWHLVVAASLWMALAGNVPLWRHLQELQLAGGAQGWGLAAGLLVAMAASLAAILSLFAWRPTLKLLATLLLVVTAAASYFMATYGALMSPGMMVNVLQTDPAEAHGLVTPALFLHLAWLAGLPVALLWTLRIDHGPLRRQLWRQPAWAVGGLVVALLACWAMFQPFSAAMRNHKDLRYLINPLAALYSTGKVAAQGQQRGAQPLLAIGTDARLVASAAQRPKLLVLVVGETARAPNFGINGYERPTTPELQRAGALSFANAWSCGTSTAESLPCMFAHLPREEFLREDNRYENLLDVLQRAGLAVLWVDNQGGCKGLCERVPHAAANDGSAASGCKAEDCMDLGMLDGLDARLAALDPARRARGVVVVLHQLGSHGPAYALRSPPEFKHFLPECTSASLQDCSKESLRNTYDNSIAYTDHFLARTIDWLKSHEAASDTALMYVSDHGESLGENNLYLHGMPYAMAPDVQKHVPWITWMSPSFALETSTSVECLQKRTAERVSHDGYFHSVLGLMQVQTQVYRGALDFYAPCRG